MIEKIAAILRIKPYHFFIDPTEQNAEINFEIIKRYRMVKAPDMP